MIQFSKIRQGTPLRLIELFNELNKLDIGPGGMDKYTPVLLDLGLKGMIGKDRRSDAVTESIHRNKAIYIGATGGAGALLSKCIKKSEIIAYEDLGTEAIRKLYVENFPVTVLIK